MHDSNTHTVQPFVIRSVHDSNTHTRLYNHSSSDLCMIQIYTHCAATRDIQRGGGGGGGATDEDDNADDDEQFIY